MSGVGMSAGMAMIYGSAIGAGGGILSSMLGGGEEAPGLEVSYIDEYDDYQGMRDQQREMYSSAMEGEEPAWMQDYYQGMQVEQERKLNREYLGTAGNRGNSAAGLAMQAGAQGGVGNKAMMANIGRVGNEMASQKTGFAADIAKMRGENRREDMWRGASGMAAMPRNPEYTTNYGGSGGGAGAGPDFSGLGSAAGNMASWGINQASGMNQANYWSSQPNGGNTFSDYNAQGSTTPSGYGGSIQQY